MIKVLVCGGRFYRDRNLVWKTLTDLRPDFVVTGACKTGADAFAHEWCLRTGTPYKGEEAKWYPRLGFLDKSAGPRRNSAILVRHPDISLCLAFTGHSGTADMVKKCIAKGITVRYPDKEKKK